jgi:hypothetical protein
MLANNVNLTIFENRVADKLCDWAWKLSGNDEKRRVPQS